MLRKGVVLFSGREAEAPVLHFAALLARGLALPLACRYVADVMGLLDDNQRAEYRALLEVHGFETAQSFLATRYRMQLDRQAAQAELEFRNGPAAGQLGWAGALDLLEDADGELALQAYLNDLVLLSPQLSPPLFDRVVQQTLLQAGAPLLLVSHPPLATEISEASVVCAWKPAAEARHAVLAAVPLLRRARKVHLLSLEEDTASPATPGPQAFADFLREAHEVQASPLVLRAADNAPRQLAEFYRDVKADLLVMGAWSHSRLRETLFGGFTHHFLKSRSCNVLFVH